MGAAQGDDRYEAGRGEVDVETVAEALAFGSEVDVGVAAQGLRHLIALDEQTRTMLDARLEMRSKELSDRFAQAVAQAYARYAAAVESGATPTHNFDHAVVRHALIDALERSHTEGKVIKLG